MRSRRGPGPRHPPGDLPRSRPVSRAVALIVPCLSFPLPARAGLPPHPRGRAGVCVSVFPAVPGGTRRLGGVRVGIPQPPGRCWRPGAAPLLPRPALHNPGVSPDPRISSPLSLVCDPSRAGPVRGPLRGGLGRPWPQGLSCSCCFPFPLTFSFWSNRVCPHRMLIQRLE